jgi:dimethylamine/trimethylamine dehydrogenase
MGQEWRRDMHPEKIPAKGSEKTVLVVGGGPAGLEAARALGQRGYAVTLAEGRTSLGGRVSQESALPGLAEWARVRDWRITQLNKLPNVEIFLDSHLDEEQILEFGADRVALATGAAWRKSGVGRSLSTPIEGSQSSHVLTPDDIMDGAVPEGPVLVFDDDKFYLGSLLAEKLRSMGLDVTLVTPAGEAAAWTVLTEEQHRVQARLMELGVRIETSMLLQSIGADKAVVECIYTERTRELEAASIVMVTSREPRDEMYHALYERIDITRIGDCGAPGIIASAVFSGHCYAREMDAEPSGLGFRRERRSG